MEKPLIPQSDLRVLYDLLRGMRLPDKIGFVKTIRKAAVLEDKFVTPKTVRLNSTVEVLDLNSNQRQIIKIVMPDSVQLERNSVSVFAPLSVVLLGHEKGDVVKLGADGSERRLRIVNVTN